MGQPARQDDPGELWKMIEKRDAEIHKLRSELSKFQNYVEIAQRIHGTDLDITSGEGGR